MKSEKLYLRELILLGSMQLDQQRTLSVVDVEKAILDRNLIDLLRTELPGYIENTSLSLDTTDATALNDVLYNTMISEVNPAQPGKSASKWGIHTNGICFVISLCTEALTADL